MSNLYKTKKTSKIEIFFVGSAPRSGTAHFGSFEGVLRHFSFSSLTHPGLEVKVGMRQMRQSLSPEFVSQFFAGVSNFSASCELGLNKRDNEWYGKDFMVKSKDFEDED